jgi:cytochrome bd-type quinol oxidase subunit 2
MPKSQSQSGAEGAGTPPPKGVLRTVEAALERAAARLAGWFRRHALDLATGLAVVGGLFLLYAETLDLFRVVTPGGVTSNAAGSIQSGADQHSWALGVIGVVIGAAALLARWTRQRLPAWAAVALAVLALGIVLIADLPDVTSSGLTTEIETAEAQPEAGFWVELVGALAALCGAAGLAWGLSRDAAARRRSP